MNDNLLLELKWHVEQGNEEEALRVARILAEEWIRKEHPNMHIWDQMLFLEVIHKTAPLMVEKVKSMFLQPKRNAS